MVNKEKSCTVFTANVPKVNRKEIEECLKVKIACTIGIYLGIPSFWGKSKCEAMIYVRDKVVSKLKN